MVRRYFLSILAIYCVLSNVFAKAAEKESLTFGLLPYLAAGELIKKYTPLVTYLGDAVGAPIAIVISKNYDEHIKQVGEDKFDLAFLGGAPYVKMVDLYGKKPLLARYEMKGKPTFQGVIFVAKSSPLKNLSELAGKRFAFGSVDSTLNTLVPSYMLAQAGVKLSALGSYEFLKNQQNVVLGVLLGDYTAGCLAQEIFDEYESRGIRALALSPPISTHLLVASKDLPSDIVKKLETGALFFEK